MCILQGTDWMGSLASEYKAKVNKEGRPAEYKEAENSLWSYNKLINPKFFKESRPHLKVIATVLQAIFEHRIIKFPGDNEWRIIAAETKDGLDRSETEYTACRCLAIDIPPRHGKSYNLSQFCDWVYGKDQNQRIIAVTYNEILAGRFSVNVRDGIEATKADKSFTVFNDIFPDVHIKYGDSAKQMWSLEGQFFNYLGTGFGGTITGVGCSIGIIDDPVKNHIEAFNDDFLDAQYQWYTDTFLSRLEEDAIQIINMTRWNSRDLVGRVLSDEDGGDWYVLKMKACIDEQTKEMLCPELFSWNSYIKKKVKMSLAIFMANYQQDPVDLVNALYKDFKEYDSLPMDGEGNLLLEAVKSYCDTADTGSDFLCHIVYGVYNMEAYVLDIIYTDEDMSVTEHKVAASLYHNRVSWADIESNNGGLGFARAVARILMEEFGSNFTHIETFFQSANKEARIKSNATWVQEHIYYPRNWKNRWNDYYMAMKSYQAKGNNKHDDAPDCTTGICEKMGQSADDWLY